MKNILYPDLPVVSEEVSVFPIKTNSHLHLNKLHEINNDILLLTSEIETKYPELYKHLDETPVFTNASEEEITVTELENYLESLDTQLYNYFDTHELNIVLHDFVFE